MSLRGGVADVPARRSALRHAGVTIWEVWGTPSPPHGLLRLRLAMTLQAEGEGDKGDRVEK